MAVAPTKVGVATAVLQGIGAPVNQHTLGSMVGWFNAEGGHWNNTAHYNPLNTTLNTPGAQSINSAGVRSYQNWGQGINATIQTLKQPNMSGIVQAFRSSDPQGIIHAIAGSPWGTSGSLVAQTIGQALGQRYTPGNANIARAMSAAGVNPLTLPGGSYTIQGKTTTNVDRALADAMFAEADAPVSSSGRVAVQNPLADALALIQGGGYTSTSPSKTVQLPGTVIAGIAASRGAGGKDVNPLQHFTLGRTDMGVDANAAPGTPVLAPNDAQVVGIMPNWYQGQPYVALRLTAGPNKGKIMYVAEQITKLPRVGQVIRRGQPIVTYAPSGTGIEVGWASPQNWQQTLAQATGQLGSSDHSNAPAGQLFRNYLSSVGA